MGSLKVVGLGPGEFSLITLEAWDIISGAETLLLRTKIHPSVAGLTERGITFSSYDDFYETADNFEALYSAIADDVMKKATEQDVVYAVPGSPVVAERTVAIMRERAAAEKIPLTIYSGVSFLDVLYARAGIDPLDGMLILDAADLSRYDFSVWRHLPSLVITQVYNERIASETKLTLMDSFSDEQEVIYAHHLSLPDEKVLGMPLYELDRRQDLDHLTSVLLKVKI